MPSKKPDLHTLAKAVQARHPLPLPDCLSIVAIVLELQKAPVRVRKPQAMAERDAEILRLAWEKLPYLEIAKRVGLTTASSVAKRVLAMRTRGEFVPDAPRGAPAASRPLTARVLPLLYGGYTYAEIAKRLAVSVADVVQAEATLRSLGDMDLPDQEEVESWRLTIEDADRQYKMCCEVMEDLGPNQPDNPVHRYAVQQYAAARDRRKKVRGPDLVPKNLTATVPPKD